jgi:hypothetical protein
LDEYATSTFKVEEYAKQGTALSRQQADQANVS